MKSIEYLLEKTKQTKIRTLEMCLRGGYGHPTSAFSCAEIVTVLYYDVMNYDITNPDWKKRDRFIMSKNHGSVILMPILNDIGYMTDEEFYSVMRIGSKRTSHTNIKFPGMDFTGGSLGIGLGVATGVAKAAKMNKESYLTFCILGDAEMYEGSIWEAVLFASHNKLNNLIVIVDRNRLGCSDFTENMIQIEPLEDKWRSFGWEAERVNGHSIPELQKIFGGIRCRQSDKPLCIIADTVKGKGVDFMEDEPLYHGTLPRGEEIEEAFRQLREE